MNINELDNARVSDAVNFHQDLNPQLYLDEQMRGKIYSALMNISNDFMEFMGIDDIALTDVTVSGSNAAYSYTPHSDIDLHFKVDFSQLSNDDVYRELFASKQFQYNEKFDIKVKGYEVEVYVQDSEQVHITAGEYSLLKKDWNIFPTYQRPSIDDDAVKSKFQKLKELAIRALASDDQEYLDNVLAIFKRYRKAGLSEKGEFGPENLAFKILRKQGYFKKLHDRRSKDKSRELSLEDESQELVSEMKEEFENYNKKSSSLHIDIDMLEVNARDYEEYLKEHPNLLNESDDTKQNKQKVNDILNSVPDITPVVGKSYIAFNVQTMLNFGPMLLLNGSTDFAKLEDMNDMGNYTSYVFRMPNNKIIKFPKTHEAGDTSSTTLLFSNTNDSSKFLTLLNMMLDDSWHFKNKLVKTIKEHGRIVQGVNTTNDVSIDQTKIEAKKLGFDVTRDGVPPLLRESILNEVNMSPSKLKLQVQELLKTHTPIIGIEAECVIPGGGNGFPEEPYQWEEIGKSDTNDDLRRIFEGTNGEDRLYSEVISQYDEWTYDQEHEWVQEQVLDSMNSPYVDDYEKRSFLEDYDVYEDDDIYELLKKFADDDLTEIDDDLAKKILHGAHVYYKEHGKASSWETSTSDDDNKNDTAATIYYWIFVDGDTDSLEETIAEEYRESYWNSEVKYIGEYFIDELNLDDYNDVMLKFSLYPPEDFYDEGDMGAGFDESFAEDVANHLEDIGLSTKVAGGYHGATRDDTNWILEPDESIDSEGEFGVEIISPPMEYTDGIRNIVNVFELLNDELDATTNDSTGLHVNVSIKGIDFSQMDYTKLVLLSGDKHILQQFNRDLNIYTKSSFDKIVDVLDGSGMGTSATQIATILSTMKSSINNVVEKSSDIVLSNFGKFSSVGIKDDYIEFRSPGNSGYLTDTDSIINTINRFVVTYAIACDPEAYKKEYAKKLYKLISANIDKRSPTISIAKVFTLYSTGQMTLDDAKSHIRGIKYPGKNAVEKDIIGGVADSLSKHYIDINLSVDDAKKLITNGIKSAQKGTGYNNMSDLTNIVMNNLVKDIHYYDNFTTNPKLK